MVIVPYLRLKDGRSNGAIITFNDITEIIHSKKINWGNQQQNWSRLTKIMIVYSIPFPTDLLSPIYNIQEIAAIIQQTDDTEEIKGFSGMLIKLVAQLKGTILEPSAITKLENEALEFEE